MSATSLLRRAAVIIPVAESAAVADKIAADYPPGELGVDTRLSFVPGAPPSIETPNDVALVEHAVIVEAERVAAEGADVIIVSCFSDPGVRGAAAATGIPVIGEGGSTIAAVGASYESFSIISASSTTIGPKTDAVRALGFGPRLRSVHALDVGIAGLEDHIDLFVELIARAAGEGSSAVVLACTGLVPGITADVRRAAAAASLRIAIVDPAEIAGRVAATLAHSTVGGSR